LVWCDDDLEPPLEVVLLELYDADCCGCCCCCSEAWRLTNLNSVSMEATARRQHEG
jgi:hypothetical protein